MAEIDTHSKVTTPRLGPAPARIGVAAASSVVDQPTSTTPVPRKLPWIAKRVAIWAAGSIIFAYAFHLTGFVPIGVIAIVFPIGFWAWLVIQASTFWGSVDIKDPLADMDERRNREYYYSSRMRNLGF